MRPDTLHRPRMKRRSGVTFPSSLYDFAQRYEPLMTLLTLMIFFD
jgi:hypothetical protein